MSNPSKISDWDMRQIHGTRWANFLLPSFRRRRFLTRGSVFVKIREDIMIASVDALCSRFPICMGRWWALAGEYMKVQSEKKKSKRKQRLTRPPEEDPPPAENTSILRRQPSMIRAGCCTDYRPPRWMFGAT